MTKEQLEKANKISKEIEMLTAYIEKADNDLILRIDDDIEYLKAIKRALEVNKKVLEIRFNAIGQPFDGIALIQFDKL